MKRLAKTIVKVLLAYVDIVQKEFDAKELDERTVSYKYFKCIRRLLKYLLNTHFQFIGLYINEQHPTTKSATNENVRIHGWKAIGGRCYGYSERLTNTIVESLG